MAALEAKGCLSARAGPWGARAVAARLEAEEGAQSSVESAMRRDWGCEAA
jgi:hypothetical protein